MSWHVKRQKTMRKGTVNSTDTVQEDLRSDSLKKITNAVKKGSSFHEACSLINITDVDMRKFIVNDALKLLVSEMHYGNGMPLKQLALKLGVSLCCLLNAKEKISEEGEESASSGYPQGTRESLPIG